VNIASALEMLASHLHRRCTAAALVLQALLMSPRLAHAQPVLISIEGQGALALTKPQSKLFGPGGAGAVAVHLPLAPAVLLGLRLRAGALSDGDPPEQPGVRDPGPPSFELASLMLRLRPFASGRDVRRAPGFFLDLGAGGGITGRIGRPSFEAGLGWGFPIGATVTLAPTARYLQIWQPKQVLAREDARLLLLGLELTFNDAAQRPQLTAAKSERLPIPPPAPPPDRDHDGISDAHDRCPTRAEDRDGFQDEDGCPDLDNDGDDIPDAKDQCPNQVEDRDGFEDEDGCPDPDNDRDTFLDADDKCPNEPETVNGNDDYDGCPDEGLIELKDSRIVLPERVLFDYQLSRVRKRAYPTLDAIMKLKKQHPEWVMVRIEGHTDARGKPEVNQRISEKRANAVMEALIKRGYPADQITAEGFGETRLRDHGDSEQAHQKNRRVEFVVEKIAEPKPEEPKP
jgi:outer membrane protein OmpA-like peptidoglycan-associated protein